MHPPGNRFYIQFSFFLRTPSATVAIIITAATVAPGIADLQPPLSLPPVVSAGGVVAGGSVVVSAAGRVVSGGGVVVSAGGAVVSTGAVVSSGTIIEASGSSEKTVRKYVRP